MRIERLISKSTEAHKSSSFPVGIEREQGHALIKITKSPKVPNHEIQGAQHKAYMKEIRLSGRPKAKVSRLRHPGTLRAKPWGENDQRRFVFFTPSSKKLCRGILITCLFFFFNRQLNFRSLKMNRYLC